MDEYSTAHIKTTALNEMCDGGYQYPAKGGTSVMIAPIIIICGNKHPQDIYPNTWKYIAARFNVFNVD